MTAKGSRVSSGGDKKMFSTFITQKQTHRHREQTCGCQGGVRVREGWSGSLGLADANYYL